MSASGSGQGKSTIERAFELARSGSVATIVELRRALESEGYGDARMQTDGASIMRQLGDIIRAARGMPPTS